MEWCPYIALTGQWYKWRRSRLLKKKIYTQEELNMKLSAYRDWLMQHMFADYERLRNKILEQENLINELKGSKGATKGNKAVRAKRKASTRKR
jgi:hypothetical protein